MKVEILNWDDYAGRKGIIRPSWFAFPVKYFLDPEYMGVFDADMVATMAYLFVQGTRSKGIVNLSFVHANAYLSLSETQLVHAISKLQEIQLVRADVTRTLHACAPLEKLPYGKNKQVSKEVGVLELPEKSGEEAGSRIYEDDAGNQSAAPGEPSLPRIAIIWNRLKAEVLAPVKLCGATRKKHAMNRWKEHPSEEFWNDVIWQINQSEFCTGKNDRGWKADFDFLIRPDTAAKVLEGKYANKNSNQPKKLSLYDELRLAEKAKGENREN